MLGALVGYSLGRGARPTKPAVPRCPHDGSQLKCLLHDHADVKEWLLTTDWIRTEAARGDVPSRAA